MPDLTIGLRAEYQSMYDTSVIRPERAEDIERIVQRIRDHRIRYFVIETAMQVPWQWIGVIHQMESDGDFQAHLHNGDPLTSRTVNAPRGRPIKGAPPFSWHDSAFDALNMRGLADSPPWDIPRMLYEAERWNGFGYRNRRIPSPYLWAGTQHYVQGKYTKDHTWDPNAVSKQIGVAPILKRLLQTEPISATPVT